jgi:AbrB family looped-hinge helix DNA binding protein
MAYRSSETTVTDKGQVTIPVDVRRALGLKPRDKVSIEYDAQRGVAVIRPVPSVVAFLYGAVEPRRRPEDFRALREEFERGVAEEVAAEDR